MSTEPPDDQPYTASEMRVIFERAGKLEVESPREHRYSLTELQVIGAQAGLDARDIAKAAVTVRSVSGAHRLLGHPTRFQTALQIGHRLSESGLHEVVDALRQATGLHGDLRLGPLGVEWRARSSLGAVIVDFLPRRQGTRISILISREDEAATIALGAGAAGLIAGLGAFMTTAVQFHGGWPLSVALGLTAAVGTAWGGTRLFWHRSAHRWRGRLQAVKDAIARAAERTQDDVAE